MKSGGEPNSREHQSGRQQNAFRSMSPHDFARTCNRSSPTRNASDHSYTSGVPEITTLSDNLLPRLHLVLLSSTSKRYKSALGKEQRLSVVWRCKVWKVLIAGNWQN
jgi:hypothetical protein